MKQRRIISILVVLLSFSFSSFVKIQHIQALGDTRILSYSTFWDTINDLWIVGEVKNFGATAVEFVKVTGTFYDASHQVIAVKFGYTEIDTLLPGRRSPFDLYIGDSEGAFNVSTYVLQVTWHQASSPPFGLKILSYSSYTDLIDYMHIVGEIQNLGTSFSNYTKIIATFYDSNNTVVGEDFAYTDPSTLDSGQIAPFGVILFSNRQTLKVINYTLTAESWQYAIYTELPDSTPPQTSNNYDKEWYRTDFTITLAATDDGNNVNQTYYRINSGPIRTVKADGQPYFTLEGANNTLEYWTVDYANNEEMHRILAGIKLDKTQPLLEVLARTPSGTVEAWQDVTIQANATDAISGIKGVTVTYTSNQTLGQNTDPMLFNAATGLYECTIPGQEPHSLVQLTINAFDNAENGKASNVQRYNVIPEFATPGMIMLTLLAPGFLVIVLRRRKGLSEK